MTKKKTRKRASSVPSSGPELADTYERYFPYLVEIRRRLMFIAAFFLVAASLGFLQYERIVRLVLNIFQLEGVNIVFTSPFQFMNLAVSSAFFVGIITIFPLIVYQVLSFLKPALSKHEFKTIVYLIPLSLLLFMFGFSTGAIMMRYVVELFYEKSLALDIGNFLDISKLLSQIIVTAAFMGLAFQFPVIMTILMRIGLISFEAIKKQRILAYGASIVFAALLPPTDVFSLLMLTAPLIILFEATMFLNRYMFRTHLMPAKGR